MFEYERAQYSDLPLQVVGLSRGSIPAGTPSTGCRSTMMLSILRIILAMEDIVCSVCLALKDSEVFLIV